MWKRVAAFVAVVALSLPVLGGPAMADAEPNGRNCVGVSASSAPKPGFGTVVSEIAKSEPGAIANLVGDIRGGGC